MGTRVSWQDRYAIALTTSMTDSIMDMSVISIGLEGDGSDGTAKFVMPLTEHPHLTPGSATLDNEMALGIAERHDLEFETVTAEPATVTLTMPVNEYNLSFFAGLLFQAGATESVYEEERITNCVPYISADPDKFCTIVRQLTDSTVDLKADVQSHIIQGAICNSLTISGEEGNLVFMTAEMIGYSWDLVNSAGAGLSLTDGSDNSWDAFDVADSGSFLKYEDVLISLGGTTFKTPNFSITLSNNAVGKLYNSDVIQQFVIGRLTGEGTFRIPFGAATVGGSAPITAFKDGTVTKLVVGTGSLTTTTTSGDWHLSTNVQYTDTGFGGEDEIGSDMSFSALKTGTLSTDTIFFNIAYDSTVADRSW